MNGTNERGTAVGMLYRRLRRGLLRLLPGNDYPARISVEGPTDEMLFEVWSDVERYRVEKLGGEQEFLTKFLAHLKPDDVVFDVGASVGLMTVLAASVVRDGKVVAFEPDPETRARLEGNVRLNGLRNVAVVDWAASDSESTTELYTNGASGYAPSLRHQSREGAPSGQVEVRTGRIDRAVGEGELPSPSVLKIDVEGAEGLCLRGARRTLLGEFGCPPRLLFLELHPAFLPDFGDSVDDVHAMVDELGFNESWRLTRENETHLCYRSSGLGESDDG